MSSPNKPVFQTVQGTDFGRAIARARKERNPLNDLVAEKIRTLKEIARFCPVCNYAVTKFAIDHARDDYTCPYCHDARISQFYAIDSVTHLRIIEEFRLAPYGVTLRGKPIKQPPCPTKKPDDHPAPTHR